MDDFNAKEISAVAGEIRALNVILKKFINTLSPAQAAKMAVGMTIELEAMRSSCSSAASQPDTACQMRVLESFVQHLSDVAKSKL